MLQVCVICFIAPISHPTSIICMLNSLAKINRRNRYSNSTNLCMPLKAGKKHKGQIMAHPVSFFSLLLLLCSLNRATSEVYHIRINSASADLCTAPCLTLSEFTTNLSHYLHSNTTLVFLPGIHYLTVNLLVFFIENFSMISESATTQIVCKNNQHFLFKYTRYISISNLEFIGCRGNQVEHVEKFLVKNIVFNGQNNGSIALEIIKTATQIFNSTFKFNKRGKIE